MSMIKRILGLLFIAGNDGLAPSYLKNKLNLDDHTLKEVIHSIQLLLAQSENSPVELAKYNQVYKLVTKKELFEDVKDFAQDPYNQELSQAAIETLAIIAYRQPITRLAIEEIRGVASQNMIQKLLLRDIVKEVGRVKGPGRPILYGVSDYFLDYFGLESMAELPSIEPLALNAELASEELFRTKECQIELFDLYKEKEETETWNDSKK